MHVWIAGRKVPKATPTVDHAGTFNYVINQNHEFYKGRLPGGDLRVLARPVGGGRQVSTSILVH